MTGKKSEDAKITQENIKIVVGQVEAVKNSSPTAVFAAHMYIHALTHAQDTTALAAGFQAGAYLDKNKTAFNTPVDCVMGILVTLHGLETVAAFSNEELAAVIHAMAKLPEREIIALAMKQIEAGKKELLGNYKEAEMTQENIDSIMMAMPTDGQKH